MTLARRWRCAARSTPARRWSTLPTVTAGATTRPWWGVIASRRHEIVVATKFGFLLPPESEPYAFPVGFNFGELAVNC